MEAYDYYKEKDKKSYKGLIIAALVAAVLVIAGIAAAVIYMDIVQLDEIAKSMSSVYIKNLQYQLIFFVLSFIVIFAVISITSYFIRRVMTEYFKQTNLSVVKLPVFSVAAVIAFTGAFLSRNFFYQKALVFFNSTDFGSKDPLFGKDIGYYVFQRPFLMSIYDFISTLWLFVIVYTIAYYSLALFAVFKDLTLQDLKNRRIIRHNLINISLFFIIKTFSYKFAKEGLLYGSFVNSEGAGFVDNNIMKWYFTIAPFLLAVIVIISFIFIWKGGLKKAAVTIAAFPTIWILVLVVSALTQWAVVRPNEFNYEKEYLKYNMEQTRAAYNIDNYKGHEFPRVEGLTSEIVQRNKETIDNIRVVDYKATLDSDKQLQSLTNFYTFNEGDIINYNLGGKETPVFITAREMNKQAIANKTYTNTMFKYTHGYGVVINPINRFTKQGQTDFILSGLQSQENAELKITEPRIYYGELTDDNVIVNPEGSGKLKETDYDGRSETSFDVKNGRGIKLNFLNRLLFSLRTGDFNMLVSGNVTSQSKLLINRDIVNRAQKGVPFLTVDKDPYIVVTEDGKLKWILDAYTSTSYYPYSQSYQGSFNYIRNSVKIVIDAYYGTVDYYIIDKKDPIIKAYKKVYPDVFNEGELPEYVKKHMRYPEYLFKIQTDILKRYHISPDNEQNITNFYGNQDLWEVATTPQRSTSNEVDIEPYYNMLKLPGELGKGNELILMRPFTPSGDKHNLVSWLSVRNSYENYGELILFSFPKNDDNIFGPYQVEVKINQIDSISKDITLWGQSGSEVFKGNLLVIPIENSVLYVEPIYIKSTGQAIPEVRAIVVGYQVENEFKYGIGTDLDSAMKNLLAGAGQTQTTTTPPETTASPSPTTVPGNQPQATPPVISDNKTEEQLLDEALTKYETLKKQMEELDKVMSQLKDKKNQ
jgi:uncharacterized membrane protein (UPF0182 family)